MTWKVLHIVLIGILLISSITLVISCGDSSKESQSTDISEQEVTVEFIDTGSPPPLLADTSKKYTAYIEMEKGTMVIELFAEDVPRTVSNFVHLALQGYFDGTTFHRVLPGFMAQGGDPTGTGFGGPGYEFADEFTDHHHVAGTLSMANGGANTNGSQFFITYEATPWLDGKHSVFGQLIEGMDVLRNLTPRDPSQNPQFEGDKVISVKIAVE